MGQPACYLCLTGNNCNCKIRRGSGRSLVLADDDGETQQGTTNAPSRRHCLPGEATQAWQCSRTPDSVKTPYGCCSLGHRGTGQAMALGHCNHGVNEHHGRRQSTTPIQFERREYFFKMEITKSVSILRISIHFSCCWDLLSWRLPNRVAGRSADSKERGAAAEKTSFVPFLLQVSSSSSTGDLPCPPLAALGRGHRGCVPERSARSGPPDAAASSALVRCGCLLSITQYVHCTSPVASTATPGSSASVLQGQSSFLARLARRIDTSHRPTRSEIKVALVRADPWKRKKHKWLVLCGWTLEGCSF